jgi:hypothetical protein
MMLKFSHQLSITKQTTKFNQTTSSHHRTMTNLLTIDFTPAFKFFKIQPTGNLVKDYKQVKQAVQSFIEQDSSTIVSNTTEYTTFHLTSTCRRDNSLISMIQIPAILLIVKNFTK